MKNILKLSVVGAALALSACSFPRVGIVSSAIGNATSPNAAFVDNSVRPAKCGEASQNSILFINNGDASITAAMKAAGIKKIHHIDFRVENTLYLITKTTTIACGE